jgi:hypothetical protein
MNILQINVPRECWTIRAGADQVLEFIANVGPHTVIVPALTVLEFVATNGTITLDEIRRLPGAVCIRNCQKP